MESSEEVPPGKSALKFSFEKTGNIQGIGKLSINGKAVGEIAMPRTLPFMISFEGLDVGRDSLSPVSQNYRGEFPFQGILEAVIFDLK